MFGALLAARAKPFALELLAFELPLLALVLTLAFGTVPVFATAGIHISWTDAARRADAIITAQRRLVDLERLQPAPGDLVTCAVHTRRPEYPIPI